MQPIHTVNVNDVLQPPPGVSNDECTPLPIRRIEVDGRSSVQSFWLPEASELAALAAGHPVMFSMWGRTHPPIKLEVLATLPDGTVPTPTPLSFTQPTPTELGQKLDQLLNAVQGPHGIGAAGRAIAELAGFVKEMALAINNHSDNILELRTAWNHFVDVDNAEEDEAPDVDLDGNREQTPGKPGQEL